MTTLTLYVCDICGKKYDTEDEAWECERKGLFDVNKFPIGLMKELNHNGYVGIFSVAKVEQFPRNPHLGTILYWACRTPGYPGDSLSDELCGNGHLISSDEKSFQNWIYFNKVTDDKTQCPEFSRMVAYLRSQNIKPCYYNEKGEFIQL